MTAFARCPRPDPEYQKFMDKQLGVAKSRISSYPKINKLFEDFTKYEGIPYTESKNKILILCKQRPDCIPKNFLDPKDISDEVYHFERNEARYPDQVILLEVALSCFQIHRWNDTQYNLFKERITATNYFTSNSAFEEITTAYRFGRKFGLENVEYEPSLSNGKNSDILVKTNNKKIYLELTAINESKAEEKIQSIFEHTADYLYEKIPKDRPTCYNMRVNMTKLILTEEHHIDESKSKKMMRDWIDKLHLEELSGQKGILYFDDLRLDTGITAFSSKKFSEYPHHRYNLAKLLQNEEVKKWADKILISDVLETPFASIALENRETFSSVVIQGDLLHATYESTQSKLFPSINAAELEERSFINQIIRKIKFKITEGQYELDCPIVIMIRASLWSNMYESDSNDFSKIKQEIEKILEGAKHISGILLYASDYTKGRFIPNIHANENIKLSDSEIKEVFQSES